MKHLKKAPHTDTHAVIGLCIEKVVYLYQCYRASLALHSTYLTLSAPTADQSQTSPFNLKPAMCGTVWTIWQVISHLGYSLPNYQFSQHCPYILFRAGWEN